MSSLLSVQDALKRILQVFQPLTAEPVPLMDAFQRVLAEDTFSPTDLPPFTNSSMDGFAVCAADLSSAAPANPIELRVIADIPAGSISTCHVGPGQAARIMTGAPLPSGADAVVPVEQTSSPEPERVLVVASVQPGDYIRPRGQDLSAGQRILPAGRFLQAQDIGMLATLGQAVISVVRQPRIGLFSSGDELVTPGQALGPGQIYDSNRYFLAGLLRQAGAQVFDLGAARDDPADITRLLAQSAALQLDLILTSAGVSVGAYDFVRAVIEANGTLDFWRVNMRPGKPLAFGSFQGIPLIGLPGNPVSAFVGCSVFVLPVIRKLLGLPTLVRRSLRAELAEEIQSDGRESYLRAVVTRRGDHFTAALADHQGSGNLHSLVLANALLIIPSEVKSLPAGAQVETWLLGGYPE